MDTELLKGTLSLVILSLLSKEPMYGYAIVSKVRECTNGDLEWKEGSLYPSLHNLERQGLIESRWQGESGTRRRKYYSLTPAGRAVLATKTESWLRLAHSIGRILEESHGGD